ncbi:MAG: beta-lactamase family protein [Alphaproteobacteria bacterium]|nr:MAG: beta-lactamase family protein [Alphaproteobacteria bacterium]
MVLSSDLIARVDAIFANMDKPGHPGAGLLVIDRDEIVYRKCYGLADLETQRPVTADTSFYLGSISKQFAAMAIMMLAEQRQITYEDRLTDFFPQLPSWGADICIRHLLHHTSGLPGYLEFFSSAANVFEWAREINGVTNEAVIERTMNLAGLQFPVGSQYFYSGIGYTLLAMIVAIVSGQSCGGFLKERIFDPLGMKNTVAYDQFRPTRHKLAHGYFLENGRFERWDYPMLTVGDGGLFSTLNDLFLWDQALNTERLVPRAALEQAFTSGKTNDGTPVDYGFGWYTNVSSFVTAAEREQLRTIGADRGYVAHGGSCVAYFNYIIRLLDTQRTVLVLTNCGPITPASQLHLGGIPSPRIQAHHVAALLFAVNGEKRTV